MFASESLLGKDKDFDDGGYKTQCTSVVIQNLHD
jgi:hypothetical protein